MPDDVLIIGGGFAGLSAGVALAEAGRRVRLIEQRSYLGGRARSFYYAPMNAVVDNGQHIFMGCYHATIGFLRTIGSLDRIRFQPRLKVHFMGKEEGRTSLVFPAVPAPFHLVLGALISGSLSLGEKLQVLHLRNALRHSDSGPPLDSSEKFNSLTVDEWLGRLGQSAKLRRNLWDLLCIAALNEDPHIAAAGFFEPVLRLALFQSPRDSCIGLASSGLSECYTEAAAEFIRRHHGQVELERNVTGFLLSEAKDGAAAACRGVQISDGSVIHANAVLSAVPCFQLARLLPEDLLSRHKFFAGFTALRPAPIISVNFWFDRAVTDLEFVGLRGTNIQWLFNKGMLLRSGQNYVSLVISGAHEHI
ncbi:MAG: hydroxysqualene dehydroxylase HpnE, partial [Terriglobia bacterium]